MKSFCQLVSRCYHAQSRDESLDEMILAALVLGLQCLAGETAKQLEIAQSEAVKKTLQSMPEGEKLYSWYSEKLETLRAEQNNSLDIFKSLQFHLSFGVRSYKKERLQRADFPLFLDELLFSLSTQDLHIIKPDASLVGEISTLKESFYRRNQLHSRRRQAWFDNKRKLFIDHSLKQSTFQTTLHIITFLAYAPLTENDLSLQQAITLAPTLRKTLQQMSAFVRKQSFRHRLGLWFTLSSRKAAEHKRLGTLYQTLGEKLQQERQQLLGGKLIKRSRFRRLLNYFFISKTKRQLRYYERQIRAFHHNKQHNSVAQITSSLLTQFNDWKKTTKPKLSQKLCINQAMQLISVNAKESAFWLYHAYQKGSWHALEKIAAFAANSIEHALLLQAIFNDQDYDWLWEKIPTATSSARIYKKLTETAKKSPYFGESDSTERLEAINQFTELEKLFQKETSQNPPLKIDPEETISPLIRIN